MPVNCVVFTVVDPLSELYEGPHELIVIGLIQDLDSLDQRSILLVEHLLPQTGRQFIEQCLLIHLGEELEVVVDEIGPNFDEKVVIELSFLLEFLECFQFRLIKVSQIRSDLALLTVNIVSFEVCAVIIEMIWPKTTW